MRKTLQAVVMSAGLAVGAFALAEQDVREVPLKDGTTLLIYKDGKMSHRDARGRVASMKDGAAMETRDGKVIMMKGNEVWRKTTVEQLRDELYRGY
jgi:hypothetical protein